MFALLFKPAALFAALKEKPGRQWWVPLLCVSALAVAGGIVQAKRTDFANLIDDQLSFSRQSVPADQLDKIVAFKERFAIVGAIMKGSAGIAIAYCLCAAWLWLISNLTKGATSFMHMLGLYAWTDSLNIVRRLLQLIQALRTETIASMKDQLVAMSLTPLNFMGDLEGRSLYLVGFLANFNLFTIAHLAFLAEGLRALAGASRRKAYAIAFIPWLLAVVVGGAVMYYKSRSGS